MKKCSNRILLFVRYPVAGQAKTRLISALGPEGAARLHRRMTEHVVGKARATCEAARKSDVVITVCCTGAPLRDFRAWLGVDLEYASQPSGDLGARMRWAFQSAFRSGTKCALAIGTDVPDMSSKILLQAFEGLRSRDVVLGPAVDGGYYLIGMTRLHSELFSGINWGTESVCAQTCNAIMRLGLTGAELPAFNDVDRPEDLSSLRNDPRFEDVFTGKALISVIIPTLNEAGTLGQTLECVHGADVSEIIVADGGSQDATREIAAKTDATVLGISGGRAAQMNAGAAAANGRLLLFLHADTLPPSGYADLIRAAMDRPSTVAGAFRFRTDGAGTAMRIVEWATNLRSCVLQWPYSDQGLFIEKRVFDEVGGFASLPIMEDFELVRRLRRRGTVVTLSDAAVTSARRWQQLGVVRTTIINQIMILGFLGGVPLHRLKRLYRTNATIHYKTNQAKEESGS